jgi:uncharacterized protein (DUF433 family)
MPRRKPISKRSWLYVATARAATLEATRGLARLGAVWTPGPFLPTPDPGVSPGDDLVLLWRPDPAGESARLVGAGRVARPRRPWGGRAWIDTVPPGDPAFEESVRRGYLGPPNYRAMARIEEWTEDVREVRRRVGEAVPFVDAQGLLRGVPARMVALLEAGTLSAAPEAAAEPLLDRLAVDPRVLGGKPVLRGRRIAVEHVLSWLAAGSTAEEIVREYPEIEGDDVRACLLYAARRIAGERIDPALPVG